MPLDPTGLTFDLLHQLDRLDDVVHADGAVLLATTPQTGGGEDVEEGAVAMEQHRDELDEENEGEEDKEGDAQRFELHLLVRALLLYPDVECVLQLVLHNLNKQIRP